MDARGAGLRGVVNQLANLDHLEIFFSDTAFWAHKISWYVVPDRSSGNSILFTAFRFVVDPATNDALPLAHKAFGRIERVGNLMREASLCS